MLSKFAILKVFKSKWTWVGVGLLSLVLFIWHYGSLRDDLASAYSELRDVRNALKTTSESLETYKDEVRRQEMVLVEREESRRQLDQQAQQLRNELRKERESNEKLEECWDVPLSDGYIDSLHNN